MYRSDCPACNHNLESWELIAEELAGYASVHGITVADADSNVMFFSSEAICVWKATTSQALRAFFPTPVVPVTLVLSVSDEVEFVHVGALRSSDVASLRSHVRAGGSAGSAVPQGRRNGCRTRG